MPKPLTVDKPFPTTDGLCADAYSALVISSAYASPTGELNAVLQYFYHYFNFVGEGCGDIADTLEGIAVAEMLHLRLLGRTLTALGVQPVYCQNPSTLFNFYSAKYITYSRNLVNMIEDDIISERRAIALYDKMLMRLKNQQVSDIIARIREDEELHLSRLCSVLEEIKG